MRVVRRGQLEAQHAAVVLERAVQRHRQVGLAARQPLDPVDVGHRRARRSPAPDSRPGSPRRRRVSSRVPSSSPCASISASCSRSVQERAASTRRASSSRGIEVGGDAVRRAHDELDAGEDRFRELGLVLDLGAAQRLPQDVLEAAPELGVVALARHVDQAGDEAARTASRRRNRRICLPLLQVQDLLRGLEQLVVRRSGTARRADRSRGCWRAPCPSGPAGGRSARCDHPLDLAPEQRDLARVAVVGGRGEQAEEAVLADHLALGVEALDPDEVQVDRAVHGRARVRLGDHQRRRIARPAPDLRRQRGEAARGRAAPVPAGAAGRAPSPRPGAADRRPGRGSGRSSRSRGR